MTEAEGGASSVRAERSQEAGSAACWSGEERAGGSQWVAAAARERWSTARGELLGQAMSWEVVAEVVEAGARVLLGRAGRGSPVINAARHAAWGWTSGARALIRQWSSTAGIDARRLMVYHQW